jgi:hypothetical protein
MRWILAVLLSTGPVWAEPWIDYELLLRQNADKVVTTTDASGKVTRQIDFGNGVTVTCSDEGCVGVDMNGAVGCAWSIYSSLLAVAEVCSIPKERTATLAEMQGLMTEFVARNAVPPRTTAEIEAFHRQEVELYRNGDGEEGPLNCAEATGPDSDVMLMIDGLSAQLSGEIDPDEDDAFDPEAFLATPRLPVMNPCL